MCGIVAMIGREPVADILIDALKRLEYRGYDSAGIATLHNGLIDRRRSKGKLKNLEKLLHKMPLEGCIGIGHTRWATHGIPSIENAHPHMTAKVAVVHNGIIENYQVIRSRLEKKGHIFLSDTDSEVIAHLVAFYIDQGLSNQDAAFKAFDDFEGAYSLVLLFKDDPNLMIATRYGTPLTIGYGKEEGSYYLASDAIALAPLTQQVSYLYDGDRVVIRREKLTILDVSAKEIERPVTVSSVSGAITSKGEYRHFMLKEIFEQPEAIADTLQEYINFSDKKLTFPALPFAWEKLEKIRIIACGTSYYAAMTAKYWFEEFAHISVEVDIASEFRYRFPPLKACEKELSIIISQSGETLDSLEALRLIQSKGQKTLAIVNVPESSIERASDAVLYTYAGPEIGVASTKAFSTQLVLLFALALDAASTREKISKKALNHYLNMLQELPAKIVSLLHLNDMLLPIAKELYEVSHLLYMGRGTNYPIALEGALKLKELSYIHAEAYAAGELKHGPISLIDGEMPVIVVAPSDRLFPKTQSNVQEIVSRGAQILLFSDKKGIQALQKECRWTVEIDAIDDALTPIIYTIPMQLLAYHVAVLKGTDVDQPRNLAKSVTVE